MNFLPQCYSYSIVSVCAIFLICLIGCMSPDYESITTPSVQSEEREGLSLFSGPEDQKLSRERSLSARIEKSIETMPGVVKARVHLNLADKSILSSNPQEQSKAAILVQKTSGSPTVEQNIRDFVVAAVPELSINNLYISVMESLPYKDETVKVGLFKVSESSELPLKVTLGALLFVCMFTSMGLIWAGAKLYKVKKLDHRAKEG